MKKLMLAGFCAMLLAACGGGANNSGSTGGGGDGSGCSAEEAPELKGLEGAERDLMKEAVALRKEMTDWLDTVGKQSEDEREKAKADLQKQFDEIGKKYSDLRKKARELGEESAKKFDAILKEMDEMGEKAEDLIPQD